MNGTDRKSPYGLKRVCERSDSTASRSKKKNGIPDADNEQNEDDQLDPLKENEDCNYEKEDSECALPQHHQPLKPNQVMVQILTKNLLMLTGEVADRTQLAPTERTASHYSKKHQAKLGHTTVCYRSLGFQVIEKFYR